MKTQRRTQKVKDRQPGIFLPVEETRMIVIASFRYYLGRMTISVCSFSRWLEANWTSFDEGTRDIVARELEEAFEWDARDRKESEGKPAHERHYRLGHDCDRATWSRVRALYRTPRCCLCGKEMGKGAPGSIHLDGEYSCIDCAPHECEICGKPFKLAEQIIPNNETRRARHPGCPPKHRPTLP